jgi:tRNA G46 methylase TrmB
MFAAMHRVLEPDGKLTIVTDNEWCVEIMRACVYVHVC